MPPVDSDSSDDESGSFTTTNVTLGYASNEPTDDTFSQLGGHATWPDETGAPSVELAKCKVCSSVMVLLLQLNGDLPERFPGHERRIYIFSCKRKACKKKEGTIRAVRGIRLPETTASKSKAKSNVPTVQDEPNQDPAPPDLGKNIFNTTFSSNENRNPFSMPVTKPHSTMANPFAPRPPNGIASPFSSPTPKTPQSPNTESLTSTFARKARLSSSPQQVAPKTPWPPTSDLPKPYPAYHLDADYETLDPTPATSSKTAMDLDTEAAGSKDDEKDAFESTIDKTFQKFADRLAQNPEQVLRYEFGGMPLLYSRSDAAGQIFSSNQQPASTNSKVKIVAQGPGSTRIPGCQNCSSARVFELQLVPHAIAELEVAEEGLEGMEWGTVILGVCEKDCGEMGVEVGDVGWVEEWVGVQWEEDGKVGRS